LLEKGRGKVTTILVQSGTLKKGDIMIAGLEYGTLTVDISPSSILCKKLSIFEACCFCNSTSRSRAFLALNLVKILSVLLM
jgi:thymidine phosphorylase